ncbi:MAG: hypothetical protein KAT27_00100 [Desulfobacterales bacterium]|nr:hypothetical protein [Desulfobacterales bacterium]
MSSVVVSLVQAEFDLPYSTRPTAEVACGQGLSSGTKALKSARRCAQEVGLSGLTSHSSSLYFSVSHLKTPIQRIVSPGTHPTD